MEVERAYLGAEMQVDEGGRGVHRREDASAFLLIRRNRRSVGQGFLHCSGTIALVVLMR